MKTIDVLDRVRSLDPLDPAEISDWTPSFGLESVMRSDSPSIRRNRRRLPLAVGAGTVVLGIGAAAAATGLLGRSAPDAVKQHLAGLDAGMPVDLRYDPDLDNARAVAASESGALYMADMRDGGYCLEVASAATTPSGATCVSAITGAGSPLEVLAPIPSDMDPLLVAGRANDARIAAVSVQYRDGSSAVIPFGLDRAWLLEVPAAQRESALSLGVTVVGSDASGMVIATSVVPPLRDDDPSGTIGDKAQPIFVSTISDGTDLTLVRGIEGRVNVPATALTLHYPDGSTAAIDLRADGSYRYDVPAERQRSFADRTGALVATDASGATVATAPVGSVAYWRGVNG